MPNDVTVETAAKNFYYAHLFALEDSMREIARFIVGHKEEVVKTPGWEELIKGSNALLEKLIVLS